MFDTAKKIPCRVCGKKFSEQDCAVGNFFPKTLTCYKCYRDLQALDHRQHCFGKRNIRKKSTGEITRFGYDPNALECSKLCPDRMYCPLFALGEVEDLRKEARKRYVGRGKKRR